MDFLKLNKTEWKWILRIPNQNVKNWLKTTVIFDQKLLIERSMTHFEHLRIIRDQPTNFNVDFHELLRCLIMFHRWSSTLLPPTCQHLSTNHQGLSPISILSRFFFQKWPIFDAQGDFEGLDVEIGWLEGVNESKFRFKHCITWVYSWFFMIVHD